jgi:ribosomal protein S16
MPIVRQTTEGYIVTKKEIAADAATIDSLGGPAAVAERLGYSEQRIYNWRNRGIPLAERVAHKFLRRKGETFE